MLLQSSSFASPFHAATAAAATTTIIKNYLKDLNPTSALLSKSLFPDLGIGLCLGRRKSPNTKLTSTATRVQSSLLEAPVLWAGRVCIFYALLKSGLAGSPSNPLVADLETGSEDLGFSKWIEELQSKPEKEATDKRKFVSKWHSTTKGTLRRNYRIPSKTEGRHLLRSIASLLSDDDQFRDATSHKIYRVVKLGGRALMERAFVVTTCELCLMSSQLLTWLWRSRLFLPAPSEKRIMRRL
ncbi:hypothetical protein U1Q18_032061 [Sarracenia purpurea var. burkii]